MADSPDYACPELDKNTEWRCEKCGAVNHVLDAECQWCEEEDVKEKDETDERDAAWESEQWLRNMEGYGDYEGPVTWP